MKKKFIFFLGLLMMWQLQAQVFEAENSNLHGVSIESKVKGYSGEGYAEFMTNFQKLSFTFNAKKAGEYGFILKYANKLDETKLSTVKITVDDKYVVSQRLKTSESFTTVNSNATAYVEKGEHTVTVMPLRGEWLLDSVEVVKITDDNKSDFYPSNKLVTENPSPEAQMVFDYLISMRGKGILSGQQIYGANTTDIKVLYEETGKYPAVLGIDLIDFSPTRVAHGTSGGRLVSTAKKYWQEGGLITCAWHWNAPANLLDKDEPNKRWYDGFRTGASTFDFKNGIFNPESTEYKQMIHDIDVIAKPLKQLKDANVPVLWRPIHEASGGWFWWGAAGKDAYIELYKLLFERLTVYHGLNNLIWVWNGQDPAWYPGDEYVDVASYDYYPGQHKHDTATSYLATVQSASYESKLCALSENGALPNVVKLEGEKSVWSWFCTWNGEFTVADNKYSEKYTSKDTLKRFMETEWYITRDELPSLKVEKAE